MFKTFLRDQANTLLELGKEINESTTEHAFVETPRADRRRTRNDERFQEITIGSPTTGATPAKRAKRQRLYESNEDAVLTMEEERVRNRRHECTGVPVKRLNPKLMQNSNANPNDSNRGRCAKCTRQTTWYCAGCHHNLCASEEREHNKNSYYVIKHDSSDPGTLCRKTCFLEFHLEALRREAAGDNVASVTPHASRK